MHHRQILRRCFITIFVLVVVGLLTAVAIRISTQLRTSWVLEASGFRVDWQIDSNNWMSGGVTNVNYKKQSWLSGSHDLELKEITRLLNVESVGLAECEVSEPGLAIVAELPDLRRST